MLRWDWYMTGWDWLDQDIRLGRARFGWTLCWLGVHSVNVE